MNVAGVVAEYNPFHKGHAYQLRKIREIFGEDTGIVCVMSGDFVQRGEPALFSKFARAEAAVRCGADLVLELPVPYSLASAERFAQGAVHILGRLGIVDDLVFGSESADIALIEDTADCLLTQACDERIREILETGCSYPTARSMALSQLLGKPDLTKTPNDNLGIEYVKAIRQFGYSMTPFAIKRMGAMHDQVSEGSIKSGSEIRGILQSGAHISDYIPAPAMEIYGREMEQGRNPMFIQQLETAILSRLRMCKPSDFGQLLDAAEGLDGKLYQACRRLTGLNEIYDSVKSKRYTHARIRRMTMSAALGITKLDYQPENLYARVLALNHRGRTILRRSDSARSIDVISKPAVIRTLEKGKQLMFEKTADAHDLYVLGYEDSSARVGERDWMTSPIFVE